MNFTKQSWFIYASAFLPFILVIIIERLDVMKSLNDSILGPILLGCLVFVVSTILVFIEGGK